MKALLAGLIFFVYNSQAQDSIWEKESESDGILTKIGTDPKTGFPIFESIVTIHSNLIHVHKLLMDHDGLENLVYGVSESKRLSTNNNDVIVYYQLDLPWPVRDKYAITEEVSTISEDRIDIFIHSIESEYEPEENLSRIDMLMTNWELHKITENTTKVVYRSTADPMGIPNWIVKLFLSTSPKETLRNLRYSSESLANK